MNRPFLAIALLAPVVALAQGAPTGARPPVIQPKITVLGEFRDTTLTGALMPQESALSPRGNLVAYNTNNELRIWSPATRTSTVVLNGWSESITWSPAGDMISFAHGDDSSPSEQVWTIKLDPATGKALGPAQRVSLSATMTYAAQFSPDGKLLAFSRVDPGQRSSLVVVPVGGGTERVLASGFDVRRLRWAPDGSALYFSAFADSARRNPVLHRVAASGGAPQVVHDFAPQSDAPNTRADARTVTLEQPAKGDGRSNLLTDFSGRALATLAYPVYAYIGDWSGANRVAAVREIHPRGLRVISVADGKSRDVIDSTADVQAATWYDGGRRIAALAFYGGSPALVTMNADGSGMRKVPLTTPPHWVASMNNPIGEVSVSPDGKYAVYLGQRQRSLELVELSTGKQRTLTRAGRTVTPIWHRDSKSLRYMRIESLPVSNDNRSVRDITLDGAESIVRVFPVSQFPNVAWLIDENHVTAFGGGTHTLMPLNGGPDQVTSRTPIQGAGYISPDGRTIALRAGRVRGNEPATKITLESLADLRSRDVNLPFADMGVMFFSLDNRSIFIRGRESATGPLTVFNVPLDGTAPRAVARIDSKERDGAFVMSPDRKSILHTVAGVRRAVFLSLDYSDGLSRIEQAGAKR